MAEPSRYDKMKQRQRKAGETRAKNSQCPHCQRKSAFFKKVDNEDCIIRQCRYCKYLSYYDRYSKTYTTETP